MNMKRKFEFSMNGTAFEHQPTVSKAKKRDRLDNLVERASLQVSNMLRSDPDRNDTAQTSQIDPNLISATIKVPCSFIEREGSAEPKWAKYVRKECNVQFMFKKRKGSSIGEIVLIGIKNSVEQADYLTRLLLQMEMKHQERQSQSGVCYAVIPIPSHMVGYIVGRNGERIRQIMEASSTEISIEGPSSLTNNCSKIAIIVGLSESVEFAQSMIEKRLYSGRLSLRINPAHVASHIQHIEEQYTMLEQFSNYFHVP